MRPTKSSLIFFWIVNAINLALGQDDDFFFWRWGHMDGPHVSSKALGISRDGKTVVGTALVVDFERAWRSDVDWAIGTGDALPPLYNELQVQEDVGIIHPSLPSAAYAASNMETTPCELYDKTELVLDWCGSTVVGTCKAEKNSYGVQWLLPVLDSVEIETDYIEIPDIGGGISDMRIMDVSSDGTIIAGTGHNKRGPIAFWANVTDPSLLVVKTLTIADPSGKQLQTSKAEAISADGMTIVGYGSLNTGNRAFISTVVDGTTTPITLQSTILPIFGGGRYAEAYALSETEDGNFVIAGRCDSPQGPQACIWFKDPESLYPETAPWVVKPLGALAHQVVDSTATGIAIRPNSTVGELMVVGYSRTNLYASEAFVWTGNPVLVDDLVGYFYDLEYILTKTGQGELSGMGSDWVLTQATGVSALGDRIVGWGVNPEGGIEAFVITGYPYDMPYFDHE
jgi:uncharacterized membrane protein